MAMLASLTIPVRRARESFGNAPKALMIDPRHVIKAALSRAFGEGGVRPWRMLGDDGRFYTVTGWLDPAMPQRYFEDGCARIGAAYHVDRHEPKAGEVVVLDLHASPQEDVRTRDRDTGHRRARAVDVASRGGSAREAYSEWIRTKISAPRSGVQIIDRIEIIDTHATEGMYKTPERIVRTRVPRVEASVTVRVTDPGNYQAFLRRPLGPLGFVGYGSLFPEGLGDVG